MSFAIPETWTFDRSDIATDFGQHVREQLPWYDLVTSAVVQIGRHYIPRGGLVYDIGASQGNIGRALEPILTERDARLVAIEPAKEMADHYAGPGFVVREAAESFAFEPYNFAVAMLALMFVAPADIPALLETLTSRIQPGGALVLVERMIPPAGYLSIVTSRLTLAAKAAMGAPSADIIAKELSLSGVQRPLDAQTLLDLGAVEWFRFGDFAGYVIEAHR